MRKRLLTVILAMLLLVLTATFISVVPTASASSGNVSVEAVPGEALNDIMVDRAEESWPWYITRASGLIAGATLIILLLSGIGAVTGHTFRFLEPLTAWATHRALGIVFVVSILVHMFVLLFDKFVPLTIIDILVPWVSHLKPVTIFGINIGSIYVALGIIAFYGALAILMTSLLWIDKKPKIWKLTHILSYVVIVAVFIHALFLGTDTGSGWLRVVWIIGGIAVLIAIIIRIKRIGTI